MDKQRRSTRLMAHTQTTNHPNYFPLSNQRHYPGTETSTMDTESHLAPFANMNVNFDPSEGAGGLSVSSYDSVDDDRGYPTYGM